MNVLIKKLHETIRGIKPWVKFGISPFGIYRNQKSDPLGSNTNGLQNYDDLYADVLLWAREGWIDYNIPQVYWEIGHKAADYETLVNGGLLIRKTGRCLSVNLCRRLFSLPIRRILLSISFPVRWLCNVLTRQLEVVVNGMRQPLLRIRVDIVML